MTSSCVDAPRPTLADWIARISKGPSSAHLAAVETSHAKRQLTYARLNEQADLFAQNLLVKLHELRIDSESSPVCLHMHRSIDWYIAYVGCSRAGVSIVCHSRDLSDKRAEASRWENICALLKPCLVIVDEPNSDSIMFDEFLQVLSSHIEIPIRAASPVMAYHFTGGSTSASKCVKITESMVVHELGQYPVILNGLDKPKKVLQNSSLYWPASAFGQLDIAIAFEACAVLTVVAPEALGSLIEEHEVDCVGVVPSVLRSLDFLPSLKTVFTWGESLPVSVANAWADRVQLIDLLIATEYWLSFYAHVVIGEKGPLEYEMVDGVEIHIDGPEAPTSGVLYISGPMVTPGYVGEAEGSTAFCTNDSVIVKNGKIRYLGRSDDLVKIGGKFVHLQEAQECIKRDAAFVEECIVVKSRKPGFEIHVVLVLSKKCVNFSSMVQTVQKHLPTVPAKRVHFLSQVPRHAATNKIDLTCLLDQIDPPWADDPQYTETNIPSLHEFRVPNPNRWMWLVLVALLLSFDLFSVCIECMRFVVSLFVNGINLLGIFPKIFLFPFVSGGVSIFEKKIRKIIFEFPGGQLFLSLALVVINDACWVVHQLVAGIALVGLESMLRKDAKITVKKIHQNAALAAVFQTVCSSYCRYSFLLTVGLRLSPAGFIGRFGIKGLLSWIWIFYVTLPGKLGWAWSDWWKSVDTYWMLGPYYLSKLDACLSHLQIYTPFRIRVLATWKFLTYCWLPNDSQGSKPSDTGRSFKVSASKRPADWWVCAECKRSSKAAQGTCDVFGKFGCDKSKWICENCWWTDSSMNVKECEITKREVSNVAAAKPHSITDGTGKAVFECVGDMLDVSDPNVLTSLSSLLKVSLYERLRTRFTPALNEISAMALFKEIFSFHDLVIRLEEVIAKNKIGAKVMPTEEQIRKHYLINNCSPSLWSSGACDWLLKIQPTTPLANAEKFVRSAIGKLVRRHPAMRAFPLDDLYRSDYLQEAVGQSPDGFLKRVTMHAVKTVWPRICVDPTADCSKLVKFEYSENLTENHVLHLVSHHRAKSTFMPPVEFLVFLPFTDDNAPISTLFVYFRVTHLFADGYCATTIASDMDQLFSGSSLDAVANGFEVLENRLFSNFQIQKSLYGSNICTYGEELGPRDLALVKMVWLQPSMVGRLNALSRAIGIPTEIVIMAIICSSLGEKLAWRRMPVSLMHSMRDGLNETNMIGYFAEYKDLGFLPINNFWELVHTLHVKIRDRNWRQYSQTLYDHSTGRHRWDECMFPVSFNILPHMRKGDCVESVDTYWRASPRNNMSDCRLIHVYLEETKLDTEWGIRFHFNRRLFDCSWVVDYVCRSLENCLNSVTTITS